MPRSKLTPQIRAAIIKSVALGTPYAHAAKAAGVSPRTMTQWLTLGRRGKRPYTLFLRDVKKAESERVASALAIIVEAAPKTWQAAAWLLERRHPEHFSSDRREIALLKKELAEIQKELGKRGESGSPRVDPAEAGPGSGGGGIAPARGADSPPPADGGPGPDPLPG